MGEQQNNFGRMQKCGRSNVKSAVCKNVLKSIERKKSIKKDFIKNSNIMENNNFGVVPEQKDYSTTTICDNHDPGPPSNPNWGSLLLNNRYKYNRKKV